MLTERETASNDALKDALKALGRARELYEQVEYGSVFLGPLFDAQRDIQYALDKAVGRN